MRFTWLYIGNIFTGLFIKSVYLTLKIVMQK